MGKAFLSLLWSTDNQVSAIRGYSISNHAGWITQSFCATKLENNLSKYKQTRRGLPQGATMIHIWYFHFIMGIMLFLTDNTCSMDQTANNPCHYKWQILDLKISSYMGWFPYRWYSILWLYFHHKLDWGYETTDYTFLKPLSSMRLYHESLTVLLSVMIS